MENVKYLWTLINGTMLANTNVDDGVLALNALNRNNAGVYECIAYNHLISLKRRINLNLSLFASDHKPVFNATSLITVEVFPKIKLQRGQTIKLKCSIGNANIKV